MLSWTPRGFGIAAAVLFAFFAGLGLFQLISEATLIKTKYRFLCMQHLEERKIHSAKTLDRLNNLRSEYLEKIREFQSALPRFTSSLDRPVRVEDFQIECYYQLAEIVVTRLEQDFDLIQVSCPACKSGFTIKRTDFSGAGHKIRCGNCGHYWHQFASGAQHES